MLPEIFTTACYQISSLDKIIFFPRQVTAPFNDLSQLFMNNISCIYGRLQFCLICIMLIARGQS